MKKMRIIGLVLCAALSLLCLTGCSNTAKISDKNDSQARALAQEVRNNLFKYIPGIEGIVKLAAPLCVIVDEDDGVGFLEAKSMSLAAPEKAKALLLVKLHRVPGSSGDGDHFCDITYSSIDGEVSVVIAEDVALTKGKLIADMLLERYTFIDGDETLFRRLATYKETLESRDYLTAINTCKDDYDTVSDIRASDIAEPMVYMVDADWVCKPVGGNDIFARPAEKGQYVPSKYPYVRPEIAGSVSLGFTSIGKQANIKGESYYTLDEVNALIESPPNKAFCFCEVVGKEYFCTFESKSTGLSYTAETYKMRISTISMDGQLLGWKSLYNTDTVNTSGIARAVYGTLLSVDKNGDTVIRWPYLNQFWSDSSD